MDEELSKAHEDRLAWQAARMDAKRRGFWNEHSSDIHDMLDAFLEIPAENRNNVAEWFLIHFTTLRNCYHSHKEDVEKLAEKLREFQALQSEYWEVKAEADKNHRLRRDGYITAKGFQYWNKPMEERLEQIEKQIPEMQGEIDFLRVKLNSAQKGIA